MSQKDKPKEQTEDFIDIEEQQAELTRRHTNRMQLVTKLPDIPKAYIGKQAIKKVAQTLNQFAPRDISLKRFKSATAMLPPRPEKGFHL